MVTQRPVLVDPKLIQKLNKSNKNIPYKNISYKNEWIQLFFLLTIIIFFLYYRFNNKNRKSDIKKESALYKNMINKDYIFPE
tara:strand:- start:223 stop:468 length:246 start_codon:yes stop_codon:yes gene_type:complete